MNDNNIEIELKYWAKNITKEEFHSSLESVIKKRMEPLYVCSCDDYYKRAESDIFLRYRKGGEKKELTLKKKQDGNLVRKEINLNLSNNDDSSVVEFLKLSGYDKQFSIFKEAWIWHLNDHGVDISYYTLSSGRSVIEIEAIGSLNNKIDGPKLVKDWAKHLNLNDSNREYRSLLEIHLDENRAN